MFSIEQLQAFVATVESGSFSSAARRLKKAQSVVSQHIINVEIDCHTELFDRSGRYPKLTPAGKKLLPYAQALLDQHQRLTNSSLSLIDETPGEMTIALDEGIPFKPMVNTINQLQKQYPEVTLEFLSASSLDIIDMLKEGKMLTGIIFSELDIPSYLDFDCLGTISFDLYVARSHPLAKLVCKNIDDLKLHRQLLIRSRNTQTSSFQLRVSPDVWYADNYFLLLELALQGHGWCLLPDHIVSESVKIGDLIKLPLASQGMGWQANIDVLQHQQHSDLQIFKDLRLLLRNFL